MTRHTFLRRARQRAHAVQLSSRVVRPVAPLAAAGCSLRRRLRFQPRRGAFREARPEVFAEMFVLRPACAVPMRRAPSMCPAPTSRTRCAARQWQRCEA